MYSDFFYRGRWAMTSLIESYGVVPGDKIVLQSYTCIAVPQAIMALGITPLIVDTEKNSLFMCPVLLEDALQNNKVKCVVIQHTFGYLAPQILYDICSKYNVKIIEDCAHLFPGFTSFVNAEYITNNRFYSMEWGKPIPVGIGGYLEAERPISKPRKMSYNILKIFKIEIQYLGFLLFYRPFFFFKIKRIFSFLSALGVFEGNNMDINDINTSNEEMCMSISPLVKKRYLKKLNRKKQEFKSQYGVLLETINYLNKEFPSRLSKMNFENSLPIRFPIWVDNKKEVLKKASECNVPLGDWYDTPVDPLTVNQVQEMGWTISNLENSKVLSNHLITIPLDHNKSHKSLQKTIHFLKSYAN